MRVREVVAGLAPLVLVLSPLACGQPAKPATHAPPPPQVRVESAGRIQIECTPASAQVNVDGQDQGTAAEISRKGGLAFPKGLHRIEITQDGYRPFRFELILGEKPESLKVHLQPVEKRAP